MLLKKFLPGAYKFGYARKLCAVRLGYTMPVQFSTPTDTHLHHPKRMPRRFTPHPAKTHPITHAHATRRMKKHVSIRQTRRKYYK